MIVNESIRLGLEHNVTSKFMLQSLIYHRFSKEIYSAYVITAVFKASEILKRYRKAKRKNPDTKKPFMRKKMLVVDNQRYRITHSRLRLPVSPRQFVYIPLNHHVCEVLSRPGLKLGSITLNENKLCIPYSRGILRKDPCGYLGIDMNLENATCFDEHGNTTVVDMSHIVYTKMKYREVLSHFNRNDSRIQGKLKRKYGQKQKNRQDTYLHQRSKKITSSGRQIIMEKLSGIQKKYRRGNGQGPKLRFRLNSWARFKLQSMIDYKSIEANGFGVKFVQPHGTSARCAKCGKRLIPEERRKMWCISCRHIVDRDINASMNILARGLEMLGVMSARFEPDAVQGEAVKQFKDAEQIAPSLLARNNPSS